MISLPLLARMSKAVKTMPYDFGLFGLGAMAVMLVVAIVSAPCEIEEAAAQQQGQPDTAMTFGDASPEAKQLAIEIAVGQLWNLTNRSPSITFSEDGTLSITDSIMTPQGLKTLMVFGQHSLTPENGYRYDNSLLYAPNGTQIFP